MSEEGLHARLRLLPSRARVVAVENKETAREELNKELGLRRVSLAFGMVYDVGELARAIGKA